MDSVRDDQLPVSDRPGRRGYPDGMGGLRIRSQRTLHPFNPTHLDFEFCKGVSPEEAGLEQGGGSTALGGSWQSRRHRKGRYILRPSHIPLQSSSKGRDGHGTDHEAGGGQLHLRVKHPSSTLAPQLKLDVTFWIALLFTLGSIVWVINGFLVFIPLLHPATGGEWMVRTAAAMAFLGGSIFEVGSYLMVVEALQRFLTRDMLELPALSLISRLRGRETDLKAVISKGPSFTLQHHPHDAKLTGEGNDGHPSGAHHGDSKNYGHARMSWGIWHKPLWRDLGYLAAVVQLAAATIFWIPTLTGLPGVIPGLTEGSGSKAIIDVFYWTPQVVGGTGFILSAGILTLEVQRRWYLPALTDIGWHIGVWNLVGAVGFTLCGGFGYSPASGAMYESACSTYWGSWAFLLGSSIQLYEAIWREAPAPSREEGDGGGA